MITASDKARPLPILLSLAAIGAATATMVFSIAFLTLVPPQPAAPFADTYADLPVPAIERHEIQSSGDSLIAIGSPLAAPPGDMAASSTFAGSATDETTALEPATETALAPRSVITRSKRVRVIRFHREAPRTHRARLWRPDASAGPNPGGGFYTPPNINVGYINPRR
jgi:hypothetical protein